MRAKRLGRGLGNLINRTEPVPERETTQTPEAGAALEGVTEEATEKGGVSPGIRQLPIRAIRKNPFQPRTSFSEESLDELRASISAYGILQPIVVRPAAAGGFELVAGERRLRAVESLQMERIPAVVRMASDEEMQTLALVENMQREDLNAMEKARALKAMMRGFGLTQEDVATRVGKARTTVANIVRLLDLPSEVQSLVDEGQLSGAHARAVLQAQGSERRVRLARLAVERGLSVRDVEKRARTGPTVGKRRTRPEDPYVRDLEDRLCRALATEVRLKPQGKGGRIEIKYHDPEELDRILEVLQA